MAKRKKKLLSFFEEVTDHRLQQACENWGAHVVEKIRLADVFEIEGSGITNEEYRFALQSHFDFVVANGKHQALFAVEFDDSSHDAPAQQGRDAIKNRLCVEFELPLLRINGNYLLQKYRNLDLLSWLVHYWFALEALNEAQEQGHLPLDEPFDALSFYTLPGLKGRFPLWLSAEVRCKIRKLYETGHCSDSCPSHFVGEDPEGNLRAIGWLRMSDTHGVLETTGMRAQQFPIDSTILDEILVFEVYESLVACLRGDATPLPLPKVDEKIREFTSSLKMLHAGGVADCVSVPGCPPP